MNLAAAVQRLLDTQAITPERLEAAKRESGKTGVALPEILVRRGFVTEKAMASAVADAAGVPFLDLTTYAPDPEVRNVIAERVARQHEILPLFRIDNTLTIAMKDPTDLLAIDAARGRSGLLVDPVVSAPSALRSAIDRLYSAAPATAGPTSSAAPVPSFSGGPAEGASPAAPVPAAPLIETFRPAADPPASPDQVVTDMVELAVREGASDIHIEPGETELAVRFRVDGVMRQAKTLPMSLHPNMVSRIKVVANLDIAETRLPQDGRFRQMAQERAVDLRVSTVPTVYGENVVLRLLDTRMMEVGLPQLGMEPALLALYERMARQPYGLLLVTGPTGSGKTTTLYATLSFLNTPDRHIVTIEDPVEYRLPGIRQIQTNDKVGLKFANGLRSILRQDPDVIMVGEIRDRETAEIAIQSALTGHFVLSTLHTNDAASTLGRLADMGIEPFLICSALVGVASQRLVRTICTDCREPYELPAEEAATLGLKPDEPRAFFRGKGCGVCKSTGYRGRTALYEVLPITPAVRGLVAKQRDADAIRAQALQEGMVTLAQDGIRKAQRGLTTLEEVVRVTRFA